MADQIRRGRPVALAFLADGVLAVGQTYGLELRDAQLEPVGRLLDGWCVEAMQAHPDGCSLVVRLRGAARVGLARVWPQAGRVVTFGDGSRWYPQPFVCSAAGELVYHVDQAYDRPSWLIVTDSSSGREVHRYALPARSPYMPITRLALRVEDMAVIVSGETFAASLALDGAWTALEGARGVVAALSGGRLLTTQGHLYEADARGVYRHAGGLGVWGEAAWTWDRRELAFGGSPGGGVVLDDAGRELVRVEPQAHTPIPHGPGACLVSSPQRLASLWAGGPCVRLYTRAGELVAQERDARWSQAIEVLAEEQGELTIYARPNSPGAVAAPDALRRAAQVGAPSGWSVVWEVEASEDDEDEAARDVHVLSWTDAAGQGGRVEVEGVEVAAWLGEAGLVLRVDGAWALHDRSGERVCALGLPTGRGVAAVGAEVVWWADGEALWWASAHAPVGRRVCALEAADGPPAMAALDGSGERLALGYPDGRVRVCALATGQVSERSAHTLAVRALIWRGDALCSGGEDGVVWSQR